MVMGSELTYRTSTGCLISFLGPNIVYDLWRLTIYAVQRSACNLETGLEVRVSIRESGLFSGHCRPVMNVSIVYCLLQLYLAG